GGAISGLMCGTTYHFRATATNASGTGVGLDATFVTQPCAPATNAASSLTQTSATLNGNLNPNGIATSGFFEYGLTTSYGTATSPQPLGSGSSVVAFNAATGATLICGTVYHYRASATNVSGTTAGSDGNFLTLPCPPTTQAATSITRTN